MDDLKQILANKSDVFVAMESYFDLYHLSTAKNKFRQIEIFKVMKTNDKCRELRSQYMKFFINILNELKNLFFHLRKT